MNREMAPSQKYLDADLPVEARAAALLAEMTLKEKIAQLGSIYIYDLLDEAGFSVEKAHRMAEGIGQVTRLGAYSLLTPRQRAETANAIQSYLVHQTRLGIPAILHEECCSGYTAMGATRFPQMLGMASTFQPELAEAMSNAIRQQMRASGTHQGLAPVLDIYRDPRWGRVEETFGEDASVVARFGSAYVRGLQGSSLREGVMATGKHFLGHSVSEGGLNCTPVHMGPREIRETFLLPYEAAVREAGLATMMNSYSELDGQVVAADPAILRKLLREELGFDGLVVSDYLAIEMLHTFHRVAADWQEAAVKALRAGIDIELPETHCYGEPLLAAVESGIIEESLVDEAVGRLLKKKFELGLFEQPFVPIKAVEAVYKDPQSLQLAREIAARSLVLLKNEGGVLPLPKNLATVAVIGPNADARRNYLGDYSYASMVELMLDGSPHLRPLLQACGSQASYDEALASIPSVLEAITERLNPDTRVIYAQGCEVNGADCSGFESAAAAAQSADAVILVLGDRSGLAPGCTTGEFQDRASLELPGVQLDLAQAVVKAAQGKPVVAVLINGRPLALTWLAEHIPAILEAWIPGEEGAAVIADALTGAVNPGGKLPVTLPRSVGQLPIFYNRKPSGGRSHFRGDYIDLSAKPLFAFGHGLSYSRFEYTQLKITPELQPGNVVHVACEVRNVSDQAGDEVVQLYIQDEYACVPRPVKELKGFRRVHLLPGQAAMVSFELSAQHLAYYDEAMVLGLEAGPIRVMVGGGSEDIRLEGSFHVVEKIAVQERSSQIVGRFEYLV
jgi:beta-glucosidase